MTGKEDLFSGKPGLGLSNERELAKICPKEFWEDSPWSAYAMKLFYNGGDIGNWKWKTGDESRQDKQFACFQALLGTFRLSHEDKEAVAGWMLSEMLTEVPE
jgi:hypothetical protein